MRPKFVKKSYCKKIHQSAIFLHKTYLFPSILCLFLNLYFSNKSTKKIEKNITNNDKELGTIFKKFCGSTSIKHSFPWYEFFQRWLNLTWKIQIEKYLPRFCHLYLLRLTEIKFQSVFS